MAMKTKLRRNARLLALLALIAVLPLGFCACDAGDGPDGPTGPSTTYNPEIDYPGAMIAADASKSTVAPGETFGIIATLKDANGIPVEGMPLVISAESGGARGCFDFQTNPTLTDESGKASIHVVVSAGCPNGSYTFVIAPVRGPQARGYVGVKVGDTGGTAIVTGVTLTTSTPSVVEDTEATFIATATATPNCTVRFQYQAAGAGLTVAWANAPAGAANPWLFSLTPTSQGTLTVMVSAYCGETGEGLVSSPVNVTVTALAPSEPPFTVTSVTSKP
jgi:hypothetical protein